MELKPDASVGIVFKVLGEDSGSDLVKELRLLQNGLLVFEWGIHINGSC